MTCELTKVRTADNVHLHGLLYHSAKQSNLNLDAAIVCHGLGGNFYGSRLNLHIGQVLNELGLTVAQINTRGHDEVNLTTRDGKSTNLGAAFEIVDECRFDLRAWVDHLNRMGHQRIAYVGHSLGAIKSIYAQANEPHESVKAIIAVSASRLSYEKFQQLPSRAKFENCFGQASQLVEQGNGNKIIQVDFPFPTHMAAQAYVDKYGPEDRYNWLNYASQIEIPTLLAFGQKELEQNAAFIGILDDFGKLNVRPNVFDIETIPDADHFYSGRFKQVGACIENWLTNKFAAN